LRVCSGPGGVDSPHRAAYCRCIHGTGQARAGEKFFLSRGLTASAICLIETEDAWVRGENIVIHTAEPNSGMPLMSWLHVHDAAHLHPTAHRQRAGFHNSVSWIKIQEPKADIDIYFAPKNAQQLQQNINHLKN
jgi:hypothetical protein